MSYKALYREWRPKNFEDIIGQEHITITLKNEIINKRTSHAYLFCGTRGTGKTSTAKVFAKALNCLKPKNGEPCNECEMCLKINDGLAIDVVELDAASNNGVDKIREIIEDVKYPPQEANFKVYIMDEVHMLSMGAVNAFLKTLEEPPKNVVFILATTDPQRLPITILSRCQRFDFKRINKEQIVSRLRKITVEKGIFADDRSLNLIARVSDGAMRDSLSILEQAISMGNEKVDYNSLLKMLGLVTNDNLFRLIDAIIERNIEKSMLIIEELAMSGKDMGIFIKDLMNHFRNLLMIKITHNPEDVLDTSEENIERLKGQSLRIRVEEIMRCIKILQEGEDSLALSKQSRIDLELAIIKMCKIEYDTSKEVLLNRINKLEEILKSGNIKIKAVHDKNSSSIEESSVSIVTDNNINDISKIVNEEKDSTTLLDVNSESTLEIDDVKKAWNDVLEHLKSRRAMILFATLRTGKPIACKNGIITIEYEEQFKFNKDRLEKPEYRTLVEDVLSEVFKETVKFRCVVDKQDADEESITLEQELISKLGSGLEILDE